jgi:hypothetical protein
LRSSCIGKIALRVVKSRNAKEFEDDNILLAWEKLKKKYDYAKANTLKNAFNLRNGDERMKLMKGKNLESCLTDF